MAIATSNELARTLDLEVGNRPVAKRTWAITLTNDTLEGNPPSEADILTACGIDNWGNSHPDLGALGLRKISISERFQDSPYHVQVVAEYGTVTANELLTPTNRTAEWSFDGQPSQVPALFYYNGTGNSDRRPLTNSANDFFQGLTTDEQIIRATMAKNFATFPLDQMSAINCVNNATYFSCPQYSWKVAAVKTQYVKELYNLVEVSYWATQCELVYRQSGWNLQLPDVGWNFLSGGQRRRAMVFDFQNGEWIASPNPVGLDGSGNQTLGVPALLDRRVNAEVNFTSLFGTPPS